MTNYYLINDLKLVGKIEDSVPYVYVGGRWEADQDNLLRDRLMGFDITEQKDSPYRIGNSDMLMRINEISEKEALQLIK